MVEQKFKHSNKEKVEAGKYRFCNSSPIPTRSQELRDYVHDDSARGFQAWRPMIRAGERRTRLPSRASRRERGPGSGGAVAVGREARYLFAAMKAIHQEMNDRRLIDHCKGACRIHRQSR
jgi:hypothetical protein